MIREASRQEIEDLLSSRGITHEGAIGCQCYVVEQGPHQMLLTVTPLDSERCEAHITCPKEFVVRSRKLCLEAFEWLASKGWRFCYTAVPENRHKTAHNLALRVGFKNVGCYNNHTVYERSLL
jgi:hypothetical protein